MKYVIDGVLGLIGKKVIYTEKKKRRAYIKHSRTVAHITYTQDQIHLKRSAIQEKYIRNYIWKPYRQSRRTTIKSPLNQGC